MIGKLGLAASGFGVSVDEVFIVAIVIGVGLMMPVFKNLLELDAPKTFRVGFTDIF
jgi:hypothetical protein